MKHKFKATSIFALVCFLVYLYGCQKEELEIEQPIPTKGIPFKVEVPQVESYFVAESSKGKVIDKLFKALGYTTRTGGNVTESYETGIGTILTDEILAVQDVFGTKYTFKLDHPEKDFYTFFNLVMVDKGEEVVVLLKKHIMTEEFANLYRSDQKTVDDFDGSVATTLLTNPCLCEFPNEGEPEIVYPGDYTPGGSGGGGTVAGSGPSGPVGGGTGGTTHCFLISFTMTHTITYTNGNSHTKTKRYTLDTCTGIITVNNKGTKTSKDGNNQTETYNENDCCSFGAIGIMDDNKDDPCLKLKNLTNDTLTNIKPRIDYLKTKLSEKAEFGIDFKRVGNDYTSYASTQPQDNLTIEHSTGGFYYGAAHTHPISGYSMFSWGDVKFLSDLYEDTAPSTKDIVFYALVCYVKVGFSWEPKTYVIKINKPDVLKNKIINDLATATGNNEGEKIFNIQNSLKKYFKANLNDLEKAFLEYFKDYGISLYESNDDLSQWNEIKLVNNNDDPIFPSSSKTKIPCN
jgi:hypothetical protein